MFFPWTLVFFSALIVVLLICTFQKSNKYGLYLSDLQVSRHSMYITNLVCHIQ